MTTEPAPGRPEYPSVSDRHIDVEAARVAVVREVGTVNDFPGEIGVVAHRTVEYRDDDSVILPYRIMGALEVRDGKICRYRRATFAGLDRQ